MLKFINRLGYVKNVCIFVSNIKTNNNNLKTNIMKLEHTYISDDIIEESFKIPFLTPNVFIDIAHNICNENNLKNPFRNEVITEARVYLKNNHPCYSQI